MLSSVKAWKFNPSQRSRQNTPVLGWVWRLQNQTLHTWKHWKSIRNGLFVKGWILFWGFNLRIYTRVKEAKMKVSRPHAKVSHSYAQPSQPTTSHLQPGSPASTSPGVVLTSPGLFFTTPRLVRTTPRLVRTRCQVDKETQQTESHAPLASPLLVGYLRTFLVEPSLMWMIFMPRLMPLLLFPSVL